MNNKIFEFLNRPSTKLERNGFDRSFRTIYSCKAGQLLPAFCMETVPNSFYEINPINYLRTLGFNEDNFVRMKQHMDFFFVPYSAIFRSWAQFYQQTNDPYSASENYTGNSDIGEAFQPLVPMMSLKVLLSAIMLAYGQDSSQKSAVETVLAANFTYDSTEENAIEMFLDSDETDGVKKDIMGYPLYQGVVRLLDLLGYGNFLPLIKCNYTHLSDNTTTTQVTYKTNLYRFLQSYGTKYVNIWRLAAYQCVCENFYTNTHYIKPDVNSYNFDDMTGLTDTNVFKHRGNYAVDLFQFRYTPWKYDIYTAALPSAQFGAVSLASLNSIYATPSNSTSSNVLIAPVSSSISGKAYAGSTSNLIQGNFDVMDLKRAEALQAWKIAIGRAGYRSTDRFEATFGSRPNFSPDILPVRLGSIDADIMKDAVTGTSGDEFAQMAATGSSQIKTRSIKFESSDFGVIIGLFRVLPVAEYDSFGLDSMNTKLEPFDYYTPAFQNMGLQVLPAHELSIFGTGISGYDTAIGYVPRYSEYKCNVDKVHGEFCTQPILLPTDVDATETNPQTPLGDFQHFVSTRMDLETWQGDTKQFFVDPAVLDHVFLQQSGVDSTQSSDQFMVNCYFDVKTVQPMSVLGLPQFNN